jgi:endonuclease/exonuclease/phosphatase family metal-dependent hydrolase
LDYDNEHHFGLIIFSKYPIINKQDVSYPPHDYNSTFQYADILLNKDTVRVFNIHLQSLKFDKDNRNYLEQPGISGEKNIQNSRSIIVKLKKGYLLRAIQSNRIKEAIEKSPYPVIVCGDFNDVPNSYAYHTIGKNLHNVFYEKGSGTGRTFSGISPTLRIDHIFVDQQFKVNHFLRISKKLSDHYPLIADIEFRQ